jgi:hypothetical protein
MADERGRQMIARRALTVAGIGEVRAQAAEPNRTVGVGRRQHHDYRLVGGSGPGGERVDLRARGWLIGNFRQDVGASRAHPAGQHAEPQHEICRHTVGFEFVGDQSVQLLQTFLWAREIPPNIAGSWLSSKVVCDTNDTKLMPSDIGTIRKGRTVA